MTPPVKMTPEVHEGRRLLRIDAVQGKGYRPVTDWIQGYRDAVMKHVLSAEQLDSSTQHAGKISRIPPLPGSRRRAERLCGWWFRKSNFTELKQSCKLSIT